MDWDRVHAEDKLRASTDYSAVMDWALYPVPPKPRRKKKAARSGYAFIPLGHQPRSPKIGGKRLTEWANEWQAARGATPAERTRFLRELGSLPELQSFAAKDLRPFLAQSSSAPILLDKATPYRMERLAKQAAKRAGRQGKMPTPTPTSSDRSSVLSGPDISGEAAEQPTRRPIVSAGKSRPPRRKSPRSK